jgi:iron complex outermembrane receptor protein
MQTPVKSPNSVCRLLTRGLATGLLLTQPALMLFGQAAAPAQATTGGQPAEQVVVLEAFTVNGSYAGSLQMAAEQKQKSQAIVEVIAPEDIGKLPDVSIADALSRLTGLTTQRQNGRAQQITIRGFSPDFSIATLDGVEQATSSDQRSVEYDQYPSELVGGVTVYKTGQANLVGGLAGTVDLNTTSPLSVGHRQVSASVYYNWTGLKQQTPGVKKAGESYNFSYVDNFAKGTEGIYLGFQHSENPFTGQLFHANYTGDSNGDAYFSGGEVKVESELIKRDSFVGVLESEPNENIHSKLDFFLSYFNDKQLLPGVTIPVTWGTGIGLVPISASNGTLTKYTLTNVQPNIVDNLNGFKTHMASVVWNADLMKKSDWPIKAQAGWSYSDKNNEILESYIGLAVNHSSPNPFTYTVTNPGGGSPSQFISDMPGVYGDPTKWFSVDPEGWGTWGGSPVQAGGQTGYLKYDHSRDIVDSFKLSTSHELKFSVFNSVEAGISVTERFKSNAQFPSDYVTNPNGLTQPPPPFLGQTNLGYAGNINPLSWDPNAWVIESGKQKLVPNTNVGDFFADNTKVWETITRPYVMFGLKGRVFDGNIGVVADLTRQHSDGYAGYGGTPNVYPINGSARYTDVLPSLNLIFHATDRDLIRFSLGEQEQRPRMSDLRASAAVGFDRNRATSTDLSQSPWSATAGNPGLKPWRADAVDLDYEHFFANGGGYFSLATFYKKLHSYIYQQTTLLDFTGIPYTGSVAPTLYQGFGSVPLNGQGGRVSGAEATLQITSEVLTGKAVRGFGLVVNGLLVDSNIRPWGPTGPTASLPNLAKKSANLTLYYERYGFSARVNMHYQDEQRAYVTNLGIPNTRSYGTPNDGYNIDPAFHTIDAQVNYAFPNGPLHGITLYIDARNLNNALTRTYNNGNPDQVQVWQKYGALWRAGVSYKF